MARRYALPIIHRRSDGPLAIVLAVLLHGVIITALIYGSLLFPPAHQEEVLPIEAYVARTNSIGTHRDPQPPAIETPPQPSPEDVLRQQKAAEQAAQEEAQKKQAEEAQQKAAEEKAAEEKAAAEHERAEQQRLADEKAETQRVAQEKADTERREAQRVAKEKADAERKAKEAAEAQKKAEAAKKAAELKKQQEEARAKQEAADKAEQEADLKRSLAQETQDAQAAKAAAARASGEMAAWGSAITARIRENWHPPPGVNSDLQCELHITQDTGGRVTNVRVGAACNGGDAVREAVKQAAYRASPLPAPPEPSLFEANITVNFKP
jgi:colicin import membrane protein